MRFLPGAGLGRPRSWGTGSLLREGRGRHEGCDWSCSDQALASSAGRNLKLYLECRQKRAVAGCSDEPRQRFSGAQRVRVVLSQELHVLLEGSCGESVVASSLRDLKHRSKVRLVLHAWVGALPRLK